MAYVPLKIDPSAPPHVRQVVRALEDHYIKDVHCMLRLPVSNYRLDAGCNFAIAQVLLAAVGGISTTLYAQTGSKGKRYKGLLNKFYPWHREPRRSVSPSQATDILYSVIRNPLTHDLGLDLEKKAKTPKVKIKKLSTKNKTRGLTEKMIEKLERTDGRLHPMSPTVVVRSDATVVLVEALYWGVRCLTESLTCNSQRIADAEAFLAKLAQSR